MSLIILRESANTDRMHVSFTNQDFEILVTGYSKSLDMSPLDSDVVLQARGQIFMALALVSGPMALALRVKALVLALRLCLDYTTG